MAKLFTWEDVLKLLKSPDQGYKFRLGINFEGYWVKPPENLQEAFLRGSVNAHIQHAISRFLEKPENVAALLEVILKEDPVSDKKLNE